MNTDEYNAPQHSRHFLTMSAKTRNICFINEESMEEQLSWIVLDCTSAPYDVGDESVY